MRRPRARNKEIVVNNSKLKERLSLSIRSQKLLNLFERAPTLQEFSDTAQPPPLAFNRPANRSLPFKITSGSPPRLHKNDRLSALRRHLHPYSPQRAKIRPRRPALRNKHLSRMLHDAGYQHRAVSTAGGGSSARCASLNAAVGWNKG